MVNKFWKWLCLYAYKKIQTDPQLIKTGIPGIRDIDNPCKSFSPGKMRVSGFMHCDGDGHYLCKECRYLELSKKEETF